MDSFWIGLAVDVPSYYAAGSLVEIGMAWWQGVATDCIPCLSRASFGIRGAHVPTILSGLVACGWFRIETCIGGQAISVLLNALLKGEITGQFIPWLGTIVPEFAYVLAFWFLRVVILWNGMKSTKKLENYSAPILIALFGALLLWALVNAGGFGLMLIAFHGITVR